MAVSILSLKESIRDIEDFPKEGIVFKDITTLLKDKEAFKQAVDEMAEMFSEKHVDVIVGVEARGFIFGAALAYKLGTGFVPVRKKGKLPGKTHAITYDLEYGSDTLEIHEDAIGSDQRVLVVDDLLATGGTVGAVAELLKKIEANIVGVAFLVELGFLNGKENLQDVDIYSLLKY